MNEGSLIALLGSQVKDTVIAYRTPSDTFSTWWRFSDPDVKNDNRPEKYKIYHISIHILKYVDLLEIIHEV